MFRRHDVYRPKSDWTGVRAHLKASFHLLHDFIVLLIPIVIDGVLYSPMLNPLPARIPDTLDNTPGSFCTRQFSKCLASGGSATTTQPPDILEGYQFAHRLYGSVLGGGVL